MRALKKPTRGRDADGASEGVDESAQQAIDWEQDFDAISAAYGYSPDTIADFTIPQYIAYLRRAYLHLAGRGEDMRKITKALQRGSADDTAAFVELATAKLKASGKKRMNIEDVLRG